MSLENDLKNFLPHQQRGDVVFDSLLGHIGAYLDEISSAIDTTKYYSDYRKIPSNQLGNYSETYGIKFPRNLSDTTKRLLLRDIVKIHQTNGTERSLRFLFNIIGLNVNIDYIWSINPTTDNILAYEYANPFDFYDTPDADHWKLGYVESSSTNATSGVTTDVYNSPLINLSRVNDFSSGTVSWDTSQSIASVKIAKCDAFFENFDSILNNWTISDYLTTKVKSGQMVMTTLADGAQKQYGNLLNHDFSNYQRLSINVDIAQEQDDFGILVCGVYFRANSVTGQYEALTKQYVSDSNYSVVSASAAYTSFDEKWNIEVNSNGTIDFYVGSTKILSGLTRSDNLVGFWTNANINNTFVANEFHVGYAKTDFTWESITTSGNAITVFNDQENLIDKALIVKKSVDSTAASSPSTYQITSDIKGSGTFYVDGRYISLIDATNVTYDRLKIMGENYPVAHRVTSQEAVKTPYIRITVTKEDYNLLTTDYIDPTTGKVYSYTDTERYKITQEIINYFMNEGRPANVVITEISTPFSLDDLISYTIIDGSLSITQVDAGWVYDGTVNYGMDTDRYILGENFSGFDFGGSQLQLNTSPANVTVTRSYPIGARGLQYYIPTRKNASLQVTVPSDALVRVYKSPTDRVNLSKGDFATSIVGNASNETATFAITDAFAAMINIVTPSAIGSIDVTLTEE